MIHSKNSDEIRLKVELSQTVKFCIRAPMKASIPEFKDILNTILKQNYKIKLRSYILRIEDGFEILDMYKVGEILDDNQKVFIDPFNYDFKKSSENKVKKETIQEYSDISEDIKEKNSDKTNYQNNDKTNHQNNDKTNYQNNDKISPKEINSSVQIKKSSNNVGKNTGVDKSSDVSSDSSSIPPKPDDFKGFVVKKSDLVGKSGGVKIEELGTFKSLKKRKTEEDAFEIS